MLQFGVPEPEDVVAILEPLHRSPVSDTELLVYMYQKMIEALRRSDGGNGLHTNTVGKVALECWQLTAKSQASKTDRMKVWDTLFHTAMREDCWEDVRVVSCSLSGFQSYMLILIRQ
jgi:N-terminal acetyltransferase B complex non-catalytic subunit